MKNFYKISLVFLGIIFVFFSFSACSAPKKEFKEYSFDVFDTVSVITGYESDKALFDENAEYVLSILSEYHKLYDIYTRYKGIKNLADINNSAGVEPVVVDRKIIDLLLYAKEAYALTDGKVNVCMGSVLSLWHQERKRAEKDPASASLPDMDALISASEHTDINNLIIDEENSTVYISDPLCRLDVGAIAKGYATEQAAKALEAKGCSGYVLNIGGNVRTIGEKPKVGYWDIGIEDPDGEGDYTEILSINYSTSLVTSGSYQRFYIVDGKVYNHIIDSETLMPADKHLSVSVVCPDSGLADALSTAVFIMDTEEAVALIESLDGVEAIFVKTNGEIISTSGFNKLLKKQ